MEDKIDYYLNKDGLDYDTRYLGILSVIAQALVQCEKRLSELGGKVEDIADKLPAYTPKY